ncbi:MAG: Hydrolase, alpha/beta fold family [Rhodanobacteraceae bacterium]|jgi:pimeloyl-ACP methyl ester carboxylesterase|nr:MAG: Hydrolase, alpha/beta fold family [Rhodanobacteraceae bacterium]
MEKPAPGPSISKFDTVPARDGVPLAVEARGPVDAPSVLFAHGFGQSRRAWTRTAESMAERGWRTLAFDARGHGDSGRVAGGRYRLEQFVDDLLVVAHSLGQPPVLVGASLGGLLGLVAAGEIRPDPFRALVLVDITPRWETAGVERMLGFMRAHPRGFASLDEAAAEVAAYLPQRRRRKDRDELAQLLKRGEDGRLRWHWDPALLDTVAHEGERHQQRLLDAARNIDVPVLLVSGGRSDIVSDATVGEFLDSVPHAVHVEVPHATHTLAGDDNAAFTGAIEPFLNTLDLETTAPRPRAAGLRGQP